MRHCTFFLRLAPYRLLARLDSFPINITEEHAVQSNIVYPVQTHGR